jgi:glyceraldehyde 3-phosphate dehydrogenase
VLDGDEPTLAHGVNTAVGKRIVSCASCTTNAITPGMEILNRRVGVRKATMTIVHAYTAGQALVDGPLADRRRGSFLSGNG